MPTDAGAGTSKRMRRLERPQESGNSPRFLHQRVVGGLQSIHARMPRLITSQVLTDQGRGEAARHEAVRDIEAEAGRAQQASGFDIDAVTDADLGEPSTDAIVDHGGLGTRDRGTRIAAVGGRSHPDGRS